MAALISYDVKNEKKLQKKLHEISGESSADDLSLLHECDLRARFCCRRLDDADEAAFMKVLLQAAGRSIGAGRRGGKIHSSISGKIARVAADSEGRPRLLAAAVLLLYRRARHRAVGAEYAAVAGPGSKDLMTAGALMKEAAGIQRHDFLGRVATVRAGQYGFENYRWPGHGFCTLFCTVEGKPALVVALTRAAGV